MENSTSIKIELDIQAQKIISGYMVNNEKIASEIEAGIKRAFETINIPDHVERNVKMCIENAIKQSSEWGKIREKVSKMTDEIVDKYIESSINKFRTDFKITE